MRTVNSSDQFTPFGLWIRQYLRDSKDGLCVTNLDYVFEDFKAKKVMLVEEKQNAGKLAVGQRKTFKILDRELRKISDYDYWGFYTVQFPSGCNMPGPGTRLNERPITVEQLADHLNFRTKFCEGFEL